MEGKSHDYFDVIVFDKLRLAAIQGQISQKLLF